jgi:hypothetical protein
LTIINNEAKVRRSTRLLVLGNAKGEGKVISYKDLIEARAKRVEKESTQEAKGKRRRGRKAKSSPPEAEEGTADTARRGRKRKSAAQNPPESSNKVTLALAIALVVQVSRTPIAEDEIVLELWRAPVARIY